MPDQVPITIKQQRDLKQEMKEQKRQAAKKQERTKTIVTWSIVGIALVGIIALVMVTRSGNTTSGPVAPVTSADHIQGATTAPAILIEYSDFECPACGAFYPMVKNLQKKYGDKLTVVYRNYPLTQLHPYAQLAAQAAEAANLQGKFWEMHDLLFSRQTTWPTDSNVKQDFIDYAKELSLDTTKFSSDLESTTVKDRVQRDIDSGNVINIQGTPTFFLNGKQLTNPSSEDAFAKLIDAALTGK